MRRVAVLAARVGLGALEVVVARSYLGFGTWWHWLLARPLPTTLADYPADSTPVVVQG
jgi:hypothetical protein